MSVRLSFNKLSNTRDLGGMHAADGRKIRPGKLIRSGQLYFADEKDRKKLADLADTVVDLRSAREQTEKPDPEIQGIRICHLPIIEDLRVGITRDETSDASAIELLMPYPEQAFAYMRSTYTGFCTGKFARAQYSRFVRILLEPHEKAVLWHCTAGKDRAGFASVIVQEILGVSRDDIRADYLKTNKCLKEEIEYLVNMFRQEPDTGSPESEKALRYLFSAWPEYLDSLYQSIEENYGDFDGYLSRGLGITDEEKAAVRSRYLES